MATATKKTASIFTRVTPELKQQAEDVLDQLQIPMSTALSMFLQQVVNQGQIPFEIKLPDKPLDYASLTKDEFNNAIQEGFDNFNKNNSFSAEEIRNELTGE